MIRHFVILKPQLKSNFFITSYRNKNEYFEILTAHRLSQIKKYNHLHTTNSFYDNYHKFLANQKTEDDDWFLGKWD